MSTTPKKPVPAPRPPNQATAADLMTPNPVSLHGGATIPEVVAFLADTGYSAAPVIDDAGRPIGVVSRTDVIVYDRARAASSEDVLGYYDRADLAAPPRGGRPAGSAREGGAAVRASDLMTPAVFSVAQETPVLKVAEQMVALNVHRLFVIDRDGVLVGVVSALDLLRCLSGGG